MTQSVRRVEGALRPKFDAAAAVVRDALQVVSPPADMTEFVATATPEQVVPLQSLPSPIGTLDEIAQVAAQFGPKGMFFPLVANPGRQGLAGRLPLRYRHSGDVCGQRHRHGFHGVPCQSRRRSHLAVVACRTEAQHTLDEARERVRQYAEADWERSNSGRPQNGSIVNWELVPDKHTNPFAKAELVR
jgi:hypothetical protein